MTIDFINIKWYNYIHNTTLGRLINQKFHSSFTIYLKKGLAMEKNIKEIAAKFEELWNNGYKTIAEIAERIEDVDKFYLYRRLDDIAVMNNHPGKYFYQIRMYKAREMPTIRTVVKRESDEKQSIICKESPTDTNPEVLSCKQYLRRTIETSTQTINDVKVFLSMLDKKIELHKNNVNSYREVKI